MTLEEKGWNQWRGGQKEFAVGDVWVSMTSRGCTLTIDAHGSDRLLDAIETAIMEAVAKFADEQPVEPGS